MRRSHGETILIGLAQCIFIFKVMKVITYNLKMITYNFKVITWRNGLTYMRSSYSETVS